jgi:hypothetical protein
MQDEKKTSRAPVMALAAAAMMSGMSLAGMGSMMGSRKKSHADPRPKYVKHDSNTYVKTEGFNDLKEGARPTYDVKAYHDAERAAGKARRKAEKARKRRK